MTHNKFNVPIAAEVKETLGSRLRMRMAEAGVSNARLAALVGVDPATVSQWRTDKFPPSDENLAALARALSVEASWLRYGARRDKGDRSHERPIDLPRQLQLMALDFEREALEAGADAAFMRYVRSSFRDPDYVALFGGGPDESPMTADEARDEMKAHIAELRAILKRRLERFAEDSGKLAPGRDE